MLKKYLIECEGRASHLRLMAAHCTDPLQQSRLLALAVEYEAIAETFRELNEALPDQDALKP